MRFQRLGGSPNLFRLVNTLGLQVCCLLLFLVGNEYQHTGKDTGTYLYSTGGFGYTGYSALFAAAVVPTSQPSSSPSSQPSGLPSGQPSSAPSPSPTPVPTVNPTHIPTASPSLSPECLPDPTPAGCPSSEFQYCGSNTRTLNRMAEGKAGCNTLGQFCDQEGVQSGGKLREVCRWARPGYFAQTEQYGDVEFERSCGHNYTTIEARVYTTDQFAIARDVCICKAGYVRLIANDKSLNCEACPNGKYKIGVGDNAVEECLSCSAGDYLNTARWSLLTPLTINTCFTCGDRNYMSMDGAFGPTRKEGCTCRAGYGRLIDYDRVSSGCLPCEPGFYKATDGDVKCSLCAEGTYTDVLGSTVCTACHSGISGIGYSKCDDTFRPSGQPSSQPTFSPTGQPSAQPSGVPSAQPTCKPSIPTSQPSSQPSGGPSGQPSGQPSSQPSMAPSNPTGQPTGQPSSEPTGQPTGAPTIPTCAPTSQPTIPTSIPTSEPTNPTGQPTSHPTSSVPTRRPSREPTGQPTCAPTRQPSGQPSSEPSGQPTLRPTMAPSGQPTSSPSSPSGQPTGAPTSVPSTLADLSPIMEDLYWQNSFYITCAFTFVMISFCCLYYFTGQKLTCKSMIMKLCGCDNPKDTGNWCFCMNKSAEQIAHEKAVREQLDARSYIPLDPKSLEEARRAIVDGTVEKKKRLPLSLMHAKKIAPAPDDDEYGTIEMGVARRTNDNGEAISDKIQFSQTSGVSDIAYRGGRGKNFADMKTGNTASNVAAIKAKASLLTPVGNDIAAIMARRDMEAELLAKGGTPGDGRSDHRRTAKDTRALSYDEDPDKITVGNFLRAVGLFKTPNKVAPAPEEEEASGTRTGGAVAGMGTLKGVAMFSKLARKVISHRPPVEKKASNPLDDDDW